MRVVSENPLCRVPPRHLIPPLDGARGAPLATPWGGTGGPQSHAPVRTHHVMPHGMAAGNRQGRRRHDGRRHLDALDAPHGVVVVVDGVPVGHIAPQLGEIRRGHGLHAQDLDGPHLNKQLIEEDPGEGKKNEEVTELINSI